MDKCEHQGGRRVKGLCWSCYMRQYRHGKDPLIGTRHRGSRKGEVRTPRTSMGHIHPVEWRAYYGARARCLNKNVPRYSDYGGRGIKFLFKSFEQFFAELGPRPARGYTVDREDNDGHYEPGNVRWATYSEQNKNQRPRKILARFTIEELHEEIERRKIVNLQYSK